MTKEFSPNDWLDGFIAERSSTPLVALAFGYWVHDLCLRAKWPAIHKLTDDVVYALLTPTGDSILARATEAEAIQCWGEALRRAESKLAEANAEFSRLATARITRLERRK
jgi:hypothetical protein